jgi:hypothetical protein
VDAFDISDTLLVEIMDWEMTILFAVEAVVLFAEEVHTVLVAKEVVDAVVEVVEVVENVI